MEAGIHGSVGSPIGGRMATDGDTDPVVATVQAAVDDLLSRCPALDAELLGAIQAENPGRFPQGVAPAARRLLRAAVKALGADRLLNCGEAALLATIVSGSSPLVTAAEVAASLHTAHRVLLAVAARAVGRAAPDASVAALALSIVADRLLRIAQQASASLATSSRPVAPTIPHTRSAFLHALLTGSLGDEDAAVQARAFGIDLSRPAGLALLCHPGRPDVATLALSAMPSLSHSYCLLMSAAVVPHVVAVVPAENRAWSALVGDLSREGRTSRVSAILAAPVVGTSALHVADRRASGLLRVARDVHSDVFLSDINELLVYELIALAPPEVRHEFVSATVGPLLGLPLERRAPLLHVLDVLRQVEANTRGAANALGLHINTIRYRVTRAAPSFTNTRSIYWKALTARARVGRIQVVAIRSRTCGSRGAMQDSTVDLDEALRRLRLRYGDAVIRPGGGPLPEESWPTHVPALNQLLPGGGLPKGRLTVIAAEGQRVQPHTTTGQRSLLGALLAEASHHGMCGYLDLPKTLDIGYLFDAGMVSTSTFLVLRPPQSATGPGLAMGRSLIRAGLPFLAVAFPPQPGPEWQWTHPLTALLQAAWRARAALVASASAPLPPALAHAASAILTVSPGEWHRQHGVVLGRRATVTLTKSKLGAPGASTTILVNYPTPFQAPGVVGIPSLVPDLPYRDSVFQRDVDVRRPRSA
jgi:hypothetical protein